MKLQDLKRVDEQELKHIQPGFALVALITAIPTIVNAIASVVGLIKTSLTDNGEIKDKINTFKWDNSKKETTKSSPNLNKYISF